ncbi:Retrotransposon protein [Nesidiocoris tenuis]|uniref:Retrotransposon protein n=1 Tax=Nesidiocoris tenuis TaxID=355587 RepID=A0ABN7ADY4_9HEMI|nr:Retrotransposon protein [Nesidiocoris tenuis]
MSFASGVMPAVWKHSFLDPILKAGDRSDVRNYRPICSISTIPKVMEKLLVGALRPAMRQFIVPEQHGFIGGRSTTTSLLTFQEVVLRAFEEGCQVDCVYTDFAKAFDKVPHQRLLLKLEAFGIFGRLLAWLASYLADRRLTVRLKSACSHSFMALSGVPQGSHLGPLLFLIFINDVGSVLPSDVGFLVYADDIKLFRRVAGVEDGRALQAGLDRLDRWCVVNGLLLSTPKCCVVSFSRSPSPILFEYSSSGSALSRKNVVRDLGVLLDSQLSFVDHIELIVGRAMRALGFLRRTARDFTDPTALVSLFNALVRPVLEYASPVWSPFYAVHSLALERVQNHFLRFVGSRTGTRWWDVDAGAVRREHGWASLADRRAYLDSAFFLGLLRGLVDAPSLLQSVNLHVPGYLTRNPALFWSRFAVTNYQHHAPLPRMARNLNSFLLERGNVDVFSDPVGRIRGDLKSFFRVKGQY